jgi:hypothetical protein
MQKSNYWMREAFHNSLTTGALRSTRTSPRQMKRSQKFDDVEVIDYDQSAGWSSLVARWAHNPKVGGSNPPPATNAIIGLRAIGHSQQLSNKGELSHSSPYLLNGDLLGGRPFRRRCTIGCFALQHRYSRCYSAVVGSITDRIREIRLAGKPLRWAWLRTASSSGAT